MSEEKSKNHIKKYLIIMLLLYLLIIVTGTNNLLTLIMEFFYYLFIILLSREIDYKIGIISKCNDNNKITKLSTEEANIIKFKRKGLSEPFHSDRLDSITGTDYEAKIITNRDGKEIFVEKIRYGGLSYFGSLVGVIFLIIVISSMIYSFHMSIIEQNKLNFIFSIIIVPFMSIFFLFYNDLMEEIKEKKRINLEIKEGSREKEKSSVPNICYRIMLFSFLGTFAIGILLAFIDNLPNNIEQILKIVGAIGIGIFLAGFVGYIISCIIYMIIYLKNN